MKKIGLILAGCLVFTVLHGARADYVGDIARAAARRVSVSDTDVSNRQKSTGVSARTNTTATATHVTQSVRNRTATNTTTIPTRSEPGITERPTNVSASRTPTNIVSRPTPTNVQPRETARSGTRTPTYSGKSRIAVRAAKTSDVTQEDILSRDYATCKKVFFDCMDEFCANKDAQLKRCACSSRIHEFDSVKRQLAAAEEKMQDFNERLLTVSMDKEDAAALSVATEGEKAYLATKDTSSSKKTLNEIAKKLNTRFDSSNFDTGLNILSWSLDMDSAFDTVDSLRGASTTAKSGTALFSAALPICREMAAEVCSKSDVALAESGYAAAVEQDCNAVAKTYQAQVDQARAKVLEGSALLDMSRLDAYQKRNSDDILTCKKKMLDMLTNSTVCGTDLGKCLDITGQYVDPSTGEAFLSPQLTNLAELIQRPTGDNTWASMPENSAFVSFLNSKKKFLEPAMEQCQDISDAVWKSFMDDALSQIKLAQNKKLEEVRQSCTALTAQCLSNASESLINFDARALSTFGIAADIAVNTMCANVLESCTALLERTDGTEDWKTGVSEITTAQTYDTLIQTCRQVGRACIIQVCSSTSGNFGLCESISNSTNRKSIINHTACWDEVKDCIASAGEENINKVIDYLGYGDTGYDLNFYKKMYDISSVQQDSKTCVTDNTDECVYDMCSSECGTTATASLFNCHTCRLAESIWGNCEASPTTILPSLSAHNKIKTPADKNTPTLLYWFAVNTGTETANDSCRDTTCGAGYDTVHSDSGIQCIPKGTMCYTSYNNSDPKPCNLQITIPASAEDTSCQCCNIKDGFDNCCESGKTVNKSGNTYCVQNSAAKIIGTLDNGTDVLICDGTMDRNSAYCSGRLILVNTNNQHYTSPTGAYITEGYRTSSSGLCTYDGSSWPCTQPDHWSVIFDNN